MFEWVPKEINEMPPGPVLAGFLEAIDVNAVSGHDRIVLLRAHQRLASYYTARALGDMAAVADVFDDPDPEAAFEAAAAEVRAALRLTRRAATNELWFALELRDRLPLVRELLVSGAIDVRRARVIAAGVIHLPVETAREVVDRIAERAPGWTTGQIAVRLRKLCIEVDPEEAETRYDTSVAERRVVAEQTVAGTVNLFGLDLPPDRVAAATRRINKLARDLRGAGESRTMDQIRADVLLDLLTGSASGTGPVGGVEIQVDLATLAELSDAPGDLAGYGPVIADIARQVTDRQARTPWRYTITDPDTGLPLHTGVTRRRPTTAQRRHVTSRDRTCIFPGCRAPATDCDLDHRIPYSEGGSTAVTHLDPLCRPDHTIRHTGWTHHPLPNGDHHWTSRLGHTYTSSGLPP